MGLEGVVVMTPEGQWEAVTVGEYGVEEYSFVMMPILLIGEIILAFEVFLIVFVMLYQIKMRHFFRAVLLFACLAVWGFVLWICSLHGLWVMDWAPSMLDWHSLV